MKLMRPRRKAALLSTLFVLCSCTARSGNINPSPSPDQAGTDTDRGDLTKEEPVKQNPTGSTVAMADDAHLSMSFEKANFEAYAIDLDKLSYTLKFTADDGTSIVDIPKSPLEFDQATEKGSIKVKVKKGTSGIVFLKVEDETPENDKFEGQSARITVVDSTPVAIALKQIGDGTVTINVSFDDDGTDDGTTDGSTDQGTVDPIDNLPAALQAQVRSFGDPNDWTTPTLEQMQPVAAAYCNSCHPSEAPGDTTTASFYTEKRISEYMDNKKMPNPGSLKANDMNKLAEAGFDYRAAMVRYAKSLGNTQ